MKPLFSMRDALSDPNLLGNALPGDSWLTWRALLIAAMGEPLTDEELVVFRAVTGREHSPTKPCDELIGIVGRRGGKSRAIAVLATYLAALCDYTDVLVPGERGLLLCVAPDMRQATIVHGYVEGAILTAPVLRALLTNSSRSTLKLTNGIDVEVRAANWRRLRGVTCVAAVADESCFWFSDESSANRDTEILQAIRPALATTHGLLAIISTPYARRGATFEAFARDYGPRGDPAILVATGASRTFNPSLSESVIARAYERDPVAAAAEYGGEWRTDIAAFLTREAVEACVDIGVIERPPVHDFTYCGVVDPSGGSNDSFTLAISHLEASRPVLDLVREVRPPFSPESVVAEFCETLVAYRVKRVQGDRYAGEWPREQFRKRGVIYQPAEKTASQLFLELLPLINAGAVGLLDQRRLIDQLVGLERRTAFGTGRDSVGHPPGAHDDVANAVAGALVLVGAKKPRMRMGTYCPTSIGGNDGHIHWHGEEPRTHSRIRWITVDKDGNEVRR